jgi:hypothetical protein
METGARKRLGYALGAALAIAMLAVVLIVTGAKNPTPTNVSGGGPGSNYPGMHHGVSYIRPLADGGPDGS